MDRERIAGRFRLIGVVGRGNLGELHRAEDVEAPEGPADRAVVVKTVLRNGSGSTIGPRAARQDG